jgi:hypothetical protein
MRRALIVLAAIMLAGGNCDAAGTVDISGTVISQPSQSIIIRPGHEFAADSIVHRPLPANAPLHANSAAMVQQLNEQIAVYYGVANVNIGAYSPTIWIVGPDVPTQQIKCAGDRGDPGAVPLLEEQLAAVPIPPGFVESPGGDGEAAIYQPSTGKYWEVWIASKTGATTVNSAGQTVPQWQAWWGGHIPNLAVNRGWFETDPNIGYNFGTTATGLPFLAYTVTVADWRAGVINHPLGIALVDAVAYDYYPPAQRTDGNTTGDLRLLPEGAWLRLPASLDIDAMDMTPMARMLAKAAQKYGMVVWDRAGAVALRAENPTGQYAGNDPYSGPGGIFGVQPGDDIGDEKFWPDSGHLIAGFPWGSLQVLQFGSRK